MKMYLASFAISATWLLSTIPAISAQGNIKAIPTSCNEPQRLYLQREVYGSMKYSGKTHEKWHIGRAPTANDTGYFVYHAYTWDRRDGPWHIAKGNWSESYRFDAADDYLVSKTSDKGGGWVLSLRVLSRGYDEFGFCPGKSKTDDENQLVMWACNRKGYYPNFYAVEGDNVFFDAPDGTSYRPYIDTKDMIVPYEKCQ